MDALPSCAPSANASFVGSAASPLRLSTARVHRTSTLACANSTFVGPTYFWSVATLMNLAACASFPKFGATWTCIPYRSMRFGWIPAVRGCSRPLRSARTTCYANLFGEFDSGLRRESKCRTRNSFPPCKERAGARTSTTAHNIPNTCPVYVGAVREGGGGGRGGAYGPYL